MIRKILPLALQTFVAVLILLGLLAGVFWYTAAQSIEAAKLVNHSHEVLTTLEEIENGLIRAQLAHRGYLHLQTPHFLIERQNALNAASAGIQVIERLTADSFTQRHRIELLKDLLSKRITVFIQNQGILNSMGLIAGASLFETGDIMAAKLHDVIKQMEAEEKGLLALRTANAALKIQFAQGSFVLLIAVLIIVLYLFTLRIVRADRALRIAHGELEIRVQDRTMELETTNERLRLEIAEHRQAEWALRESQNSLHQLAAHQESIREDERKRIAREIHDELGQRLLVLRIDVLLLQDRKSESHMLFSEKIGAVLDDIDAIMRNVKSIINDLRPAVLDLGLHAAVEWQLKQFHRRTGIESVLLPTSQEVNWTASGAIALFRILQESLTNVARHAQATRVMVELNADENNVLMAVRDNGIGIAFEETTKKNSFGLLGMRERVIRLGGHIEFATTPGRGFEISVSIPIQARQCCNEHQDG